MSQRTYLIQKALAHFATFSLSVVQRIVHELPLPAGEKTIPPLAQGGDTFVFEGLVIRMAGAGESSLMYAEQ